MSSYQRLKQLINLVEGNARGASARFAEKLKVSSGYLSSYNSANKEIGKVFAEKILKVYPQVSIEWLLNGVGEPIKSTTNIVDFKGYPIIDNIAAGLPKDIYNNANRLPHYKVYFPDMPGGRVWAVFIARGDSMMPYLKDGDKLLCYRIFDINEVIAFKNKAFVLDLKTTIDAQKGVCKLCKIVGNVATLTSINTYYEPFNLKLSEILSYWKIYRTIREVDHKEILTKERTVIFYDDVPPEAE